MLSNPIFTHGASGFRSLFKWLARLGLLDPQSVIGVNNPFVAIGSWTKVNTFSFAKTLYEDFGIFGLLIGNVIWGGITRHAIQKLMNHFSLVNLFFVVHY
jgi:hypothetical protein